MSMLYVEGLDLIILKHEVLERRSNGNQYINSIDEECAARQAVSVFMEVGSALVI